MSILSIVNIMKKQKKSRIAGLMRSVFNIRSWIDYDRLRSFTSYLMVGIKRMFVPQKVDNPDAGKKFDEMVERMNLSEESLQTKARSLYRLALIMGSVAGLIFAYALYHLVLGNWKATIISLVVTAIALVLAFRYHFWYFQIRQRKLGCSLHEWYREGLLGESK